MTHRGAFKDMFDLRIGDQLIMSPAEGETVEAALKRIKVRASKYRSDGRSYRVTQHGDAILIVRVPFGQTNKLASWGADGSWRCDPSERQAHCQANRLRKEYG